MTKLSRLRLFTLLRIVALALLFLFQAACVNTPVTLSLNNIPKFDSIDVYTKFEEFKFTDTNSQAHGEKEVGDFEDEKSAKNQENTKLEKQLVDLFHSINLQNEFMNDLNAKFGHSSNPMVHIFGSKNISPEEFDKAKIYAKSTANSLSFITVKPMYQSGNFIFVADIEVYSKLNTSDSISKKNVVYKELLSYRKKGFQPENVSSDVSNGRKSLVNQVADVFFQFSKPGK